METATKRESFKLFFGKDNVDIRRVTLRSEHFADVVEQLHVLYGRDLLYHPELRVQYEDEEGDKITVSTQREWEEMWNTVGSKRPVKIYIVEGPNPTKYFKDGPVPEVKCIYATEPVTESEEEQQQKHIVEGTPLAETLSISVPRGLEKLFPGGKILPYHLPEWLRASGAVTIKHEGDRDDEVDLDINLGKLVEALHQEALKNIGDNLGKESLERARVYLETLLTIQPEDSKAVYNLACAESLLGNVDAAVEVLNRAFCVGYRNVEHMEKDSDLDNIRGSEGYQALVQKMRGEEEVVDSEPEIKQEEVKQEEVQQEEVKPEEKLELIKIEPVLEVFIPVQEEVVVEEVKEVKVEPVVEEVKVEPVVEEVKVKAAETRFPEELKTLEGMGYDSSLCAFLLEEYRGDVLKALEYLFTTGT